MNRRPIHTFLAGAMIAFALLRFPYMGLLSNGIDASAFGAYLGPLIFVILGIGLHVRSTKFIWPCLIVSCLMLIASIWLFSEFGVNSESLGNSSIQVGVFSAGMLSLLIFDLIYSRQNNTIIAEQAAASNRYQPPC